MKVKIDLDLITKEMDQLKDDEARLKFELKNLEKEIEKCQIVLENLLHQSGVDSMEYGIYSFGWKTTTSRRFNQKKFEEDHPDMLEQYKTESSNSRFEFKINK